LIWTAGEYGGFVRRFDKQIRERKTGTSWELAGKIIGFDIKI
jgi:hypothetical protein